MGTTLLHGAVQRQGANIPFPLDKVVGGGVKLLYGLGNGGALNVEEKAWLAI